MSGLVDNVLEEQGNVAPGERAALKYSSMESPETQGILKKIKREGQSPYGRQLLRGQEVEKEHKGTINWLRKNPHAPLEAATRSLSSEHLDEDRKYYTHLDEMESKYKEAMVGSFFDELEKISINLNQLTRLESLAGRGTVKDIMEDIARRSGQLGKAAVPKSQPMTAFFRGGQMFKRPLGTPPPLPKFSGFFETAGKGVQKQVKNLAPRLKEKLKHTGEDIKDWAKDRIRPGMYA